MPFSSSLQHQSQFNFPAPGVSSVRHVRDGTAGTMRLLPSLSAQTARSAHNGVSISRNHLPSMAKASLHPPVLTLGILKPDCVGHQDADPVSLSAACAALTIAGMTYREIGSAVDISIPTVRKMLAAAGAQRRPGRPRKLAGAQ